MDEDMVVFNGSKILIWKQITTGRITDKTATRCFQWFKDTNLKANHNGSGSSGSTVDVVFNGSKILIWKQITTSPEESSAQTKLFSMVQRY